MSKVSHIFLHNVRFWNIPAILTTWQMFNQLRTNETHASDQVSDMKHFEVNTLKVNTNSQSSSSSSFFLFYVFKTWFPCVASAVLELTLQNRLASILEIHLLLVPKCYE